MKILVPVKRVIDAYAKVRVKTDHSGVDTQNVKMAMNPFDEIAVEQAVQLKEQGKATEIVALSIGAQSCQETLRTALALGADKAIHIVHDTALEPLHIAKIICQVAGTEKSDLIIMGKQSIDGDNNQTGQMVAALLGWPQGTFASRIEFAETGVLVTREIDGGLETLKLSLPAVLTTDLRLNTPRYATLPNIMKAKKKPLETLAADSLGLDLQPLLTVQEVTPPTQRTGGIKVESVAELVRKLQEEKVI